ncbi:MAG: glycosyltransferase family A protein [Xanthomonadales bacterium]|nr:glycosyltransferase family A protein [Xanthomonadales bacterium]
MNQTPDRTAEQTPGPDAPPRVSIGLPVYNGERWIEQTIDSILAQTFSDFELIICDNCSTDSTVEICQRYAAQDSRVVVHQNTENIGAARNFNKAFELARGRYFKWASSNDLIGERFLEACVEVLDANPDVAVAFPRTQLINERNEVIEEYDENLHLLDDHPYVRFRNFIDRVRLNNVEQALQRSSVLRQTTLQAVYPNSDTVLMSEMAARGKFFQIEEFLLSRRLAESSTTNLMTEEEVASFYAPGKTHIPFRTMRMFLAFISLSTRIKVPLSQRLKFYDFALRFLYWSKGDFMKDLSAYFRQLFRRRPASA